MKRVLAARSFLRLLGGLVVIGGAGACVTTKAQGDQMRADIDRLTERFNEREAEWTRAVKSYQDEVQQLHATLKAASDLMARNSANVGQQVQDLQVAMAQLKGEVDTIQRTLATTQKAFGDYRAQNDAAVQTLTKIVMAPPASAPVQTADGLFDQAYKELSDKKYDAARNDFRTFLLKFPFDPRAANAQFWIGDAFYQQSNWGSAIPEYQKVLDNYPSSEVADQAMYKEANAFFQVRWCGPALAYLKDLPRKYPASTELADARALARQIKKARRRRGACQR